MHKLLLVSFIPILGLGIARALPDPDQTKAAGRTLKATATYTGAGQVDADHPLYISVFDTDYIGHQGTSPLATLPLKENGGTAAFADLPVSPVYVAVFYDRTGKYTMASDTPPSGSPAALYGKSPAVADPIEIAEGATAEIQVTFDDSLTMP